MRRGKKNHIWCAAWVLAAAMLTTPVSAGPLPGSLDDMSRSDLLGLIFEGPEQAGAVLDALTARVEGLDEALRGDLQAAIAWLAETCPYNQAIHESVAILDVALAGPALRPIDAGGQPLDVAAAGYLRSHTGHMARLAQLHRRHLRLLAALGRPPTGPEVRGDAQAISALTERLGGLKDTVAQLDPTLARRSARPPRA